MPTIEFELLQKIDIKPGDLLVVWTPPGADLEARQRAANVVNAALKLTGVEHVACMVLPHGYQLGVAALSDIRPVVPA